jgi:hypothetical protein
MRPSGSFTRGVHLEEAVALEEVQMPTAMLA